MLYELIRAMSVSPRERAGENHPVDSGLMGY